MTTLKFADTHNMVAYLSKPTESDGFVNKIVDFSDNVHQPIRYALTVNPAIYISCIEQFWSTGVVKTINEEVQLHALVDDKKIIISEASVRRYLKLEDKEESSRDEESLGKDASKQGRINVIDADEDITLVNVQDDADKEMYDVRGTVTGDEVFAEQEVAAN
ncbi:hypothetical protein Tco_0641347 [Tanacetum coccineum]